MLEFVRREVFRSGRAAVATISLLSIFLPKDLLFGPFESFFDRWSEVMRLIGLRLPFSMTEEGVSGLILYAVLLGSVIIDMDPSRKRKWIAWTCVGVILAAIFIIIIGNAFSGEIGILGMDLSPAFDIFAYSILGLSVLLFPVYIIAAPKSSLWIFCFASVFLLANFVGMRFMRLEPPSGIF